MSKIVDELVANGSAARDAFKAALVQEAKNILGQVDPLLFALMLEAGDPIAAPGACWRRSEGDVSWALVDGKGRTVGLIRVCVGPAYVHSKEKAISVYSGAWGRTFKIDEGGMPSAYNFERWERCDSAAEFLAVSLAKYSEWLDEHENKSKD